MVRLRRVEKTYRTGDVEVKAVRAVDLDIARGDFVAIMGASGSGKSTLMNVLGCLDQPTSGEYLLDGAAVDSLDERQLARVRNSKLGFVFQSFNLLARTSALENVELPMLYTEKPVRRRDRRRRAIDVLQSVGLGERLQHRPSELSGGQQQRIAIARALVNRPTVVFADEPTGNLDTRTSIEIMGLFQALNEEGITIVMVTHEPEIAAYCKRTVVMRDGRIVSDSQVESGRVASRELAAMDAADKTAMVG
jgi:putative ABC transport system ATP-binding protein